jgi:hypothetical protein
VSFSAAVSQWVAATEQRSRAVFQESAQRIVEIAQKPVGAGGNMPVDTGFLRRSVAASLDGSTPPLRENPGGFEADYNPAQVNLVISRARMGDVITIGYGANYATYVEFGAGGRQGRRFVGLAAQQWPRVVDEVSREAKTRAGA